MHWIVVNFKGFISIELIIKRGRPTKLQCSDRDVCPRLLSCPSQHFESRRTAVISIFVQCSIFLPFIQYSQHFESRKNAIISIFCALFYIIALYPR